MKLEIFKDCIELKEDLVEEGREEIRRQVREYLSGGLEEFELEFSMPEDFTGEVMQEMLKIPRGKTRTYGQIAENLDSAPVAVGQACGRNPLPVVVPCHRVVGKNSLGGYKSGREVKENLLELEGADF